MSWFGWGGGASSRRSADDPEDIPEGEGQEAVEGDEDSSSPSPPKLKEIKLPNLSELDLQKAMLLASMILTHIRELIRQSGLDKVPGKIKDRVLEGEEDLPAFIPPHIAQKLGPDKRTRKKNACVFLVSLFFVFLFILAQSGEPGEPVSAYVDDGVSPVPRGGWSAAQLRNVIAEAEEVCNSARARLGGPARLESCISDMAREHSKMLAKLKRVPR